MAVSPVSFRQPPRFYSGSLTDSIPADSTASSWQSHRLHSGHLPGFPGLTLAASRLCSGSLPGFTLAVSPVLPWGSPLVLLWELPWSYSGRLPGCIGSLPGFILAVSPVLFWESPLVLLWQRPWFYSGSLPGFVLAVSQV